MKRMRTMGVRTLAAGQVEPLLKVGEAVEN
jgi:hypothetical protein